jgi:hypothetical protein
LPTFDIATFRTNFPEFSDINTYPDSLIAFWAAYAQEGISMDRFGDMYPYALALYVAHQLKLAVQNAQISLGGGSSLSSGIVASKAVGSVSVSYDVEFGSQGANAGYFNLTTYGRMFWSLLMRYGIGPVQL